MLVSSGSPGEEVEVRARHEGVDLVARRGVGADVRGDAPVVLEADGVLDEAVARGVSGADDVTDEEHGRQSDGGRRDPGPPRRQAAERHRGE